MHTARQGLAQASGPRPGYHHGNLRAALIDAGLELTRTGGPAALGLRDATRRVGVSPNAAYRHFADRQALLGAVAVRIQQQMAEAMAERRPPVRTEPTRAALEALRAVGLGYIEFALTEPGWFETAFGTVDLPVPVATAEEAAPERPAPFAALMDALDALVSTGVLTPAARAGAEWPCWSAVHGFALLVLHGPLGSVPPADRWRAAERTVDAVIAGVLAATEDPTVS